MRSSLRSKPAPTSPSHPRLAVVGKGGSGKSVVAGTLARLLAREGRRVLALDSDPMPGLELSLGVDPPGEPPLSAAAEKDGDGRWRLKKGIGPVRAIKRYALHGPDGVLMLQFGKSGPQGLAQINGALTAYYHVVHRLGPQRTFDDWVIIGDLPAGPRQIAYDWAPYARMFLVVVESTRKSVASVRRIAQLAHARGTADVMFVGNKLESHAQARKLERLLGQPLADWIPRDDAVRAADVAGAALIDQAPSSPAVRAIARLAGALASGRMAA